MRAGPGSRIDLSQSLGGGWPGVLTYLNGCGAEAKQGKKQEEATNKGDKKYFNLFGPQPF